MSESPEGKFYTRLMKLWLKITKNSSDSDLLELLASLSRFCDFVEWSYTRSRKCSLIVIYSTSKPV